MNLTNALTRGRTQVLTRLLLFAGFASALGGMLLLLAPAPEDTALHEVSTAASRQAAGNPLVFPRFGDLQASRASPFELQELRRIPVSLRKRADEAIDVVSPPGPDVTGLELVGTVPGGPLKLAVLRDLQANSVSILEQGNELRGAVLQRVGTDRIVLMRNAQHAELLLAGIKGSDALLQQLQQAVPLRDASALTGSGFAVSRSGSESTSGRDAASKQPPRSLGVSGYILTPSKQEELGLQQTGLLVTSVQQAGSPLQIDDVVLAIAGQGFSSLSEAMSLLQNIKTPAVSISLFREGSKQEVSVKLE